MPKPSFNVVVRQREKAASRERDEARLNSGQVAAFELAQRNGFFSALDPSKARISRRRIKLQSA
jgi:hypothetical protein